MSRFPLTRIALGRLFGYLAILALPFDEDDCLSAGFAFIDRTKVRSAALKSEAETAA